MKITIDLPDWIADRLMAWPVPEEHCGPSIADKIAFIVGDFCLGMDIGERHRKRNALYRMFNMPSPDGWDDDDIDL